MNGIIISSFIKYSFSNVNPYHQSSFMNNSSLTVNSSAKFLELARKIKEIEAVIDAPFSKEENIKNMCGITLLLGERQVGR